MLFEHLNLWVILCVGVSVIHWTDFRELSTRARLWSELVVCVSKIREVGSKSPYEESQEEENYTAMYYLESH